MWDSHRQMLLAEHRFYVEQARKRLLSQFDNISAEADQAADEYLASASSRFNPDTHDPSDAYETAHDVSIEFYQSLSGLHESTRLSVIAGMFYQWDKKLREWIVRELRFGFSGKYAANSIWKADFMMMMDFVVAMGFDVKSLACFERLNALRLVVNVFKHGAGPSLDELKVHFPGYFPPIIIAGMDISGPLDFRDHTDMQVTDEHLDKFSESIVEFWTATPAEMPLPESWNVPDWFAKAVMKDRAAT